MFGQHGLLLRAGSGALYPDHLAAYDIGAAGGYSGFAKAAALTNLGTGGAAYNAAAASLPHEWPVIAGRIVGDGSLNGYSADALVPILQGGHEATLRLALGAWTGNPTVYTAYPAAGSGFMNLLVLTNGRLRLRYRNTLNQDIFSGHDFGITGIGGPGFVIGTEYEIRYTLTPTLFNVWVDGVQVIADRAIDLALLDTVFTVATIGSARTGTGGYSSRFNGALRNLAFRPL
ncbi:hypothetical protein R5H32_15960 [Defluviimonas sp. D31]|uniref:hypothetical protein n=1 Tax=Defluviimonas sp. D31 TaxID=3083253 RepID=UPI00296FBEE7|nr:hypothetical protein [Defluviimonas sp. D31]MDW4550857.1 hypothetical protein [Defluviimonas sp. D31]